MVIETDEGLGSGFIIKPDGIIVTNNHVVANAKAMAVKFPSGELYRNVYLLSSDPTNDLAFLKIEAVDLPTISLGNSNNVQVGDEVLLVGSPRGLEQTVSNGLISGIRIDDGVRVLQTSAPASPGSSGGPLLNRRGEAVGVMSFKVVNGENLNSTIPINYVRGKLDTLTSSSPKSFEPLNAQTGQHGGVLVAGHNYDAFRDVLVEILDILGTKGVEVANDRVQRITNLNNGFMSLSALIEVLPKSGANSLLYVKVERAFGSPEGSTVSLQCFDATGHMLWDEKATDVLTNGWNTAFHPRGWKSKLNPQIGQPGLLIGKDQEEGQIAPKK